MKRAALVLSVMALTIIGAGGLVWAQEESESLLEGKIRAGETIVVEADETVEDDLYLFGTSITVNADVPGDVVAFGSNIVVNGDVGGDVLAGSSNLRITGVVSGDVRAGAANIDINGPIDEDVAVGAGVLTITGDIGGDVVFGAGQASINADVAGSVEGSTGLYNRDGTVGGTENVTITDDTDFEPVRRPVWARAISRYISIVLVGAALFAWQRNRTRTALDRLRDQPASSLLWGAVIWFALLIGGVAGVFLAIALALVFAFLTLGQLVGIGVFTGLLISVLCVFALVVGTVIVGPAVAGTALGEFALQRQDEVPWLALLVGVAAIVALGLIPVVGTLIGGLVVAFGLGAVFSMLRSSRASDDHVGNGPALA